MYFLMIANDNNSPCWRRTILEVERNNSLDRSQSLVAPTQR